MKKIKIYSTDSIRIVFSICVFILINQLTCIAQVSPDWKYKKELFGYLRRLDDSVYITDRIELELLSSASCTDTEVRYYTAAKSGEQIQLAIKSKVFFPSLHQVQFYDTIFSFLNKKKVVDSVQLINKIDNMYAFGVKANIPETEISIFIILRNNVKLQIPKSAYTDLYNVHFCIYHKAPEVYLTKDGVYLYIYLHGSDGGNQYSVKFIFNKSGYVTRIVNMHPCITDFDFIDGFGACE